MDTDIVLYTLFNILQHSDDTIVTAFSLDDVNYMCVCVSVYLYNYEGGNVLYRILWHCCYKVKNYTLYGNVFFWKWCSRFYSWCVLGNLWWEAGGLFGSCLHFIYGYSCNHESNCFDSWDILQHVLIILSVVLSSLISILIPVICFYTICVSVACFLAFFDEKFNFIVLHELISKMY